MQILGVIPARSGSKGVPNKNIKLLNGKPLIAYTIEAALNSNLNRVIVSTDSNEIASIARYYSAEVIMRPFDLSQDSTPTLPVIQQVIQNIPSQKFDAVATLQPTSPLRKERHINEALKIFLGDSEADSLVSVVEIPHNYHYSKAMHFDGRYLIGNIEIKRRQDNERLYARNGAAIYITKIQNIENYIFGGKILPYFMKRSDSIDIDDIDDWNIASRLLQCAE